MTNRWYIVAMVAVVLTACRADFNPVTDSSVRTMRVQIDPSGVFDRFLVAQKDTFVLGYRDSLPQDVVLRITTYCYREDESLHSQQTSYTHRLEPIEIVITHLDTTLVYSICCVADIVRISKDEVVQSNWIQLEPSMRSLLYIYHSSVANTIENHVAVARWEGNPRSVIDALVLEPFTYNGYFRLVNFEHLNYVYFRWTRYPSAYIWNEHTRSEQSSIEMDFYPELGMKDTIVPLFIPIGNDTVRYKIKTRFFDMDSAMYRINLKHRPFVCTLDCEQRKVTGTQYY